MLNPWLLVALALLMSIGAVEDPPSDISLDIDCRNASCPASPPALAGCWGIWKVGKLGMEGMWFKGGAE